MDFISNKPIYLQICDSIAERILGGELKEGDRIFSVRELGAELGVNPNTVMRAYEKLTDAGVIVQKRGVGFFVTDGARQIVLDTARRDFISTELPTILRRLSLLGLDPADLLK